MSKYMIDKFMHSVEMSNAGVEAYVADTAGFVDAWIAASGRTDVPTGDRIFTAEERDAFVARDYETLYRLGGHPYLLWHFTEAVYTQEFNDNFGWRDLVEKYRAAVAPHGVPDFIP
ncbi:hypothetical protein A20C1_08869 [marine actinobacterium PHSC20C1]|nr:hypothetical protein A20C1_08869 [marine actinobacterium PHSC20C1]